jgi:hypothetical protein
MKMTEQLYHEVDTSAEGPQRSILPHPSEPGRQVLVDGLTLASKPKHFGRWLPVTALTTHIHNAFLVINDDYKLLLGKLLGKEPVTSDSGTQVFSLMTKEDIARDDHPKDR